jgi:hypothetical protein
MEARGWSWEIWNLLPSILLPTFLLHFRLVRLPPGATIPFVSPGQDRSSWGQGHTAMKRELSAGGTCLVNRAGTAGQPSHDAPASDHEPGQKPPPAPAAEHG